MEYEKYVELQSSGSDWSYGSAWGDQMESAVRYIFSQKINSPECSIIDIGCGEGRGLNALHSMGFLNLHGIDISKEKIAKAIQTSNPRIRYTNGDFHDMQKHFDHKFDYGWCSHTLEHCLDFKKAIQSIMSVISKKLYFIVPIGETQAEVDRYNPSHTSPFSDLGDVVYKLESAGFKKWALNEKSQKDGRLGREVWGIVYSS